MILLVGRAFIFVYISFGVNPVFGQSGCQTSYTNMAIDGNDLTSVSGPSSSCCQHCQQQTGCAASTWTSANGGTCWLKNDTQPLYASTGAFSVILAPSADQTYGLKLVYNSTNLFTDFEFTTHGCCGFVNSVDKNTATGSGLIGIQNDKAYIGLDNVTVLPWNNTHGRNSVTLKSLHTLNSGLVILNVDHVPTGPGIWPAFWTSSQSWPDSGEIDIVESIWSYDHNQMTLHASQGCAMPVNDSKYFTGSFGRNKNGTAATDCWVHDPNQGDNQGCGIGAPSGTFNTGFNNAGGGVYAMEWDPKKFIRIWNFVRPNIPADIVNNSPNPNPATWGMPAAYFRLGSNCPGTHFYNQTMIFDTGLCGGWASGSFPGGECNCENTVRNRPGEYSDAYWLVNYVKVFCRPGDPCLQQ